MNAGYRKATSKLLAAVLSLLMVFGNVASPLSGVFNVYATDDEAVVAQEAENQSTDSTESADAEEQANEEDQDASDENEEADQSDSGDTDEDQAASEDADAEDNQDQEEEQTVRASESVNAVYVGGANGNDENDGLTKETAVASWDKATEILGSNAGTIYVCGTVTVSGEVSTQYPNVAQVVKREAGFGGPIFYVDESVKSATFKNIHVDGEKESRGAVGGTAVKMINCPNGNLKILENAVFENLHNNANGGAVNVQKSDGTTIIIDGAKFLNNKANGEGGAIYTNGQLETIIKSGLFEGNKADKGSVIVNYNSTLKNTITLYNALITGNKSTNDNGSFKNSGPSAGGINICQSSIAETTISGDVNSGAAIYGNSGAKGDIAVWNTSDLSKLKINEGHMLGGGNHNWEQVGEKGYKANPSDADIAKAEKNATTIIKNNTANLHGAIQSNGVITLGRVAASLRIKKVDGDTQKPLGDVVFEMNGTTAAGEKISREESTFIDNTTTEHDFSGMGVASFTDIPAGEYTLTEKTPKVGYKKIDISWNVKVDTDGNITVTDSNGNAVDFAQGEYYDFVVENERPSINISKTDMGGNELAGAQMVVKDSNGNEVDSWTSGAEAHKIKGIKSGDYTLTEVVAPKGYECVETVINFHVEVSEEGKATVTTNQVVVNGEVQASEDSLVLKDAPYKEPEVEKYVNKDVTYDFDNFDQKFTYDILAYVPYDATKLTITDELVNALEFAGNVNVKVEDMGEGYDKNDHKVNGTVAKDGTEITADTAEAVNGKLTVVINDASAYQRHWIKVSFDAQIKESAYDEVKGYLEAKKSGNVEDAENWAKKISSNGLVLTEKEHDGIPNKAKYVVETANNGSFEPETNTVTVEPKTVDLKIKKSWKNVVWNSDTTVTFGVYRHKDGQEEKIDEITLDSNKTSTTITLPKLEGVTYSAREIKVTKNGVESTTAASGNLVIGAINYIKDIITDLVAGGKDGEHETQNTVKVDVKINKTDLGGEEIKGATIVVYDSEGNEVESWESKKDETFDLMLEPGRYTFKETVAPKGYECVETKIEFTVDEDGKVTVEEIDGVLEQLDDGTMVLKDTPIRKISKNELGGSEIEGAEMTLTMPDGTVKEWISSAEEAYEFAAAPGTYKLKEVTPPSDYTQVTTEIEFTVDDHGNITIVTTEVDGGGKISVNGDTVVLEDAPKKEVKISKTDLGGEELEGATITVTGKDNAGNEVKETWESETTAHTLKLDPGTYTMEEKVAPAGYQCVETKIQFSVDADGKVTVEEIDGVLEQLDDGTIILKDAPEKPAIEKYVNKKYEDLGVNDRDGTVHTDLSAFDEVYTYDIQAYITADATVVEVTDELKSVLEFVGDAPTSVVVKDGEGDSGAVAPKLTKAGEAVTDYSIDAEAWANGKLVLTMGSDAEDAPKLYPNGKWLQITFDAKIKKEYKSIEALKAAGADVWTEITENDPIDDADVVDAFSGATAEAHEGIVNDSSYRIKSNVAALNVNVDNEWAYGVKSNTVTVVPPTTEISFSKTDLDGKELPGAEMVLTDAEGNVIDEWTSTTEDHILNLADGEYIMTEKVAPEGYYCVTTEMHFVVKDGEVTLTTAVVDNGGEIEVLAGTHIILKDAPKVQSEYEEKKDEGDDGSEEVVEKKEKVTEKTEVKKAYSARVNTGDDSTLYLWAGMLMISMIAAAIAIIRRRRTN